MEKIVQGDCKVQEMKGAEKFFIYLPTKKMKERGMKRGSRVLYRIEYLGEDKESREPAGFMKTAKETAEKKEKEKSGG